MNIGKQLDREDSSKAKSILEEISKDSFKGIRLQQLQKELLGEGITRNLQSGSTVFLNGPTATNASDVVPFLYFHRTLSIGLCSGCPQVMDPKKLVPFLDRGMISVCLRGSFKKAPAEFQKLVSSYPEFFVGNSSFAVYRNLMGMRSPDKDEEHFCWNCLSKRLNKCAKQAGKFDSKGKTLMTRSSIAYIYDLPLVEANQFVEEVERTVKEPTVENIRELFSSVNFADGLMSAKAFGAGVQLDGDFLGDYPGLAKSLRITAPRDLDLAQYLDFIQEFRGVIAPKIMPKTNDNILSTVSRINTEVEKIQNSNRLLAGYFASRFVSFTPGLISRLLRTGSYGPEGTKGKPIISSRMATLTNTKATILAKYFGTSKEAMHVWTIRRRFENLPAHAS